MRTLLPVAVLLSLAACDGASPGPDSGPLALGIVSGNHQTATAGADRLPDPVVGKLVRTPGGGLAFHLVTPAYAEGTVVTGSPVPGAVVCAVSVTDAGLTPFTPCTNTDNNGQATFFFSPGTKAGEAKSEIRGTVEGQPAVFDTVTAEVEPGALAHSDLVGGAENLPTGTPYWFREGRFEDAYHNAIPDSVSVTGSAFVLAKGADYDMGSRVGLLPAASAAVGDTATLVFSNGGAEIHRTLATLTAGSVAGTWGVSFAAGAP